MASGRSRRSRSRRNWTSGPISTWLTGQCAHYIPFDGKIESLPAVSRNICDEGHYPAYGLFYSGYHPRCYCATFVVGAVAMHSLPPERPIADAQRLTRGPAWGAALGAPATADQWPTFRGNSNRGNDGTVSCLRLSDGGLVWQFLAAPTRRRTAIASQTESAWPVPGLVVLRDRLYATAGRHNQIDGGIHAWCLDPATGAVLGRGAIDGQSCSQPPKNLPPTASWQGRSNDILAVDRAGLAVHMRDIAIDPTTMEWLNLCTFDRRGPGDQTGVDRLLAQGPRPRYGHRSRAPSMVEDGRAAGGPAVATFASSPSSSIRRL